MKTMWKLTLGVVSSAAILAAAVPRVGAADPAPALPPAPTITVSYQVPTDLPGSPSLSQAAAFAWQEFIALNWPAVPQTGQLGQRDQPDRTQLFGSPTYTGPLTWQTFRAKVEIFTSANSGGSNPPGYSPTAPSFGYDALPQYVYAVSIPPLRHASSEPDALDQPGVHPVPRRRRGGRLPGAADPVRSQGEPRRIQVHRRQPVVPFEQAQAGAKCHDRTSRRRRPARRPAARPT